MWKRPARRLQSFKCCLLRPRRSLRPAKSTSSITTATGSCSRPVSLRRVRKNVILARLQPCTFCYIAPSRILLKTEQAIAFADANPISAGHTLVAPRQHVSSIHELSLEEQRALWGFVGEVRERLLKDFMPESFYIGFKDDSPARQTVGHAHIHIIPYRQGDVPDSRGGIRWVVAESASNPRGNSG